MPSESLASAFLAAIRPDDRSRFAAVDELEELLDGMLTMAQIEWPAFSIPPGRFAAEIGRCAAMRPDLAAAEALTSLRTSDLYLATGCSSADPAALACFESSYLSQLPPALRHLGVTPSAVDEVLQRLRTSLLVASAERPAGISSYSARGKLFSFVRSAAVRQAIRVQGAPVGDAGSEAELDAVAAPGDDPEVAYLKVRYRDEFRAAFDEALNELTPMERNLLKQHHLQSLSVSELGALYQVHRATAARWVANARSKVFSITRDRLMARLGLGESSVAGIIKLVHTQLDVSIERHLGGGG